jgi:hypothetical protein
MLQAAAHAIHFKRILILAREWTDVHAFTIANTLDSALSHLIVGPIVGAIFGGVAGVVI